MSIPSLNLNAASTATSGMGPSSFTSPFNGGTINFGGSGMGGANGGFGGLVAQYWPLIAVAGAIWYMRRKKAQ